MIKKISLLVALLICTGCLWATIPKTINFAGRTYYFSEVEENGTAVFETAGTFVSSFSIVPTLVDSPKKEAEDLCKTNTETEGPHSDCQIHFCSSDDILVSIVYGTERHTYLQLIRITKQETFIILTEQEYPLSKYRWALCQFPLDTLSK